MIDVNSETLLTVRQVARRIPGRSGKPINISAIYRWIQRGVDGKRLEAVRIGGRFYTSVEALERFSEPAGSSEAQPAERTSARASAAEAELRQRHGF